MQPKHPKTVRLPEAFLGLRQVQSINGFHVVNEDHDLQYLISRRQLEALLQILEGARQLAAGSKPAIQIESWLVGLEAATSLEGSILPIQSYWPEERFSRAAEPRPAPGGRKAPSPPHPSQTLSVSQNSLMGCVEAPMMDDAGGADNAPPADLSPEAA